MPDLRKDFFNIMDELAKEDEAIHVLTGDLGYNFYERYAENNPKQFTNAGIAEQNMIGVAAGMARAGGRPYLYSGLLFFVSRANEFIRCDVAYANTNVKIVGTGASSFLGHTHNMEGNECKEDYARNWPNIQIRDPENKEELREALLLEGPVLIRL